jgi:sulfur relay (sulfurtransferase) DsrF/TusC family protein
MEKRLLVIIKSAPFTNLKYYEGLRTAAGLWDHSVKILWTGKGVFGALEKVDKSISNKFLTDFPDLDIELFVCKNSLLKNGFLGTDLVENIVLADESKISELIMDAEASLVF